jgi:hypothetical protein
MASELIVQTLKGPTSGANANKVIIPSGQTLDVSAGNANIPGRILQTVASSLTPGSNSAITTINGIGSSTDILSLNITPQSSSSTLFITCNFSLEDNGSTGGTLDPDEYWYGGMFRDSTELHRFVNASGYMAPGNFRQSWNTTLFDSPNTTSQVTYKLRSTASFGSAGSVSYYFYGLNITIMEIAG